MAVSLSFDLFAHDREVVRAFERLADKAERVEGALRDIGGVDAFGGLVGEVQVAALAVEHAFKDAARDADRALEGIGADVAVGIDRRRGLIRSALAAAFKPDPELVRGFVHSLSTALSTPAGLAVAAGIVGTAGPLLVSGLAAAVLGGVGAGLVGVGALALRENERLRTAFTDTGRQISEVLARAAKSLEGPFLVSLGLVAAAFTDLEPALTRMFKALGPSIAPFTQAMIAFVEAALPGLEAALPGIAVVFEQLAKNAPALGAAVGELFRVISENEAALRLTVDLLADLAIVLIKVLGGAVRFAQGALLLLRRSFQLFGMAVSTIMAMVSGAVGRMVAAVRGFFARLGALPGIVAGYFARIVVAATTRLNALVAFVRGIPGRILGALGNLGGLLYGAGRAVIGGLLGGIRDALAAVWAEVSSIAGRIASLKGPLDRDRRLLEPAGLAIIEGLRRGLVGGQAGLAATLAGVTGQIAGGVATPGGAVLGAATAAAGAGGASVVIEVRPGGGQLDAMFLDWLKKAVRVRGGNVQVVLGSG